MKDFFAEDKDIAELTAGNARTDLRETADSETRALAAMLTAMQQINPDSASCQKKQHWG